MERKGYKAFYKGMKNRYGTSFQEGKIYTADGPLKFGNPEEGGNGFHFCLRMEDTLRYVPATEEEFGMAEVTSLGEVVEGEDDYNGYYDMYAARSIRIDKILTREEIVELGLKLPDYRVVRFLQTMKLTPEETARFKEKYQNNATVLKAIAYHQDKDEEAYYRPNSYYVKEIPKR